MPNIKSAKKRVEVSEKRRAINKAYKSELATGLKKFKTAVNAGELEQAKSLLAPTIALVDKSVTRGVIHKNKADRKKAEINSMYIALAKTTKSTVKAAKAEVKEVKAEVKEEVKAEAPKAAKTTAKKATSKTATAKTAKAEEKPAEKKPAVKKATAKKETKKAE